MDNDELIYVRRYDRVEAAGMLKISKCWLRDWVAAQAVPHQRKGQVRGVWFTYDDILAIGHMLPELMSVRQTNRRAEDVSPQPGRPVAGGGQLETSLPPELLQQIASLRSLRAT